MNIPYNMTRTDKVKRLKVKVILLPNVCVIRACGSRTNYT